MPTNMYFRRTFKDAYKVDLEILRKVEKLVKPFATHPLIYSIDLEGGYSVRDDSFEAVAGSPLVETKTITRIGVTTSRSDKFHFDFHIANALTTCSFDFYGDGDALAYEGLVRRVEDQMNAARPWYWWFYRVATECIAVPVIALSATAVGIMLLPGIDPNFRSFVSSGIGLTLAATLRSLMFARVEFQSGISKRRAETRASYRGFIGVPVIVGLGISILASWIA